jgi:hypothetical protein
MEFETANLSEVRKALRTRGFLLKHVAMRAGGVSEDHVGITLTRYCGVIHPRGPQSPKVKRILATVRDILEPVDERGDTGEACALCGHRLDTSSSPAPRQPVVEG